MPDVICERCSTPYHVQRVRLRRDSRRLCSQCRRSAGGLNSTAFTPESSKSDRVRANGLINKRIKLGKIKRPSRCQYCGQPARTDGHHPDYRRPDLIVFLCRSCHMKAHHNKAFEAEVAAKASSTGALYSRASQPKAESEVA